MPELFALHISVSGFVSCDGDKCDENCPIHQENA